MTDSQLRELERRWRETGAVEDEARYLLERVRAGDLEQEKLELAAYCGHEGARAGLGGSREQPTDVAAFLSAISKWNRSAWIAAAKAACAAVHETLAAQVSEESPEDHARKVAVLARVLEATGCWESRPSAEASAALAEAAEDALQVGRTMMAQLPHDNDGLVPRDQRLEARRVTSIARALAQLPLLEADKQALVACQAAVKGAAQELSQSATPEALLKAVLASCAAWALRGDPTPSD